MRNKVPFWDFSQFAVTLTIQLNISHLFTELNIKTVLFQAMQFSLSTHSFIGSIDRTLSSAITPGQSGSGNDGFEGVLHISQTFTRASPSDCLVSYSGHLLGEYYPRCRDAVDVFFSHSQLGHVMLWLGKYTRL